MSVILSILGLGFFVFFLFKYNPVYIVEIIKTLTWKNFLILFFLRFIFWMIRSINWKLIMETYNHPISLYDTFKARIAGHAIGYLTPASKIGGETFKVIYIKSIQKQKAIASAVIDKTVEIIVTIIFISFGLIYLLSTIPFNHSHKWIFYLVIPFLLAVSYLLYKKQKSGILTWIINILRKFKIKLSIIEKNIKKIEETDQLISKFYVKHPGIFLKTAIFYLVMLLLWTTEFYFNLTFLGMADISWMTCLLIISLSSVAFLLPGLPGSIGIIEITYISIFTLLGIPLDFGLSLIIIRRILGLIWAGIGLIPVIKKGFNRR